MNPLHWPERLLQTPGPLAAKACLNGTSGRTDGRPARALVEPLRRVRGNTWLWWTAKGLQLLATGRGKAVRTAAVPARAVVEGTGCVAPHPAGAPGPPERTSAWGGLGVAGAAGHAVSTVAQAVLRYIRPRKTSADGGGSHRRSRAMEQWLRKDVATKTRLTRARGVRDLQRGDTPAPCPLEVVQSNIGDTKHLWVSRGVLGGANGQRDSDALATRGNHRHEARRHRTVALGAGGTNHRSPDNDNAP